MSVVAIAPMTRRTPVPALPWSMTSSRLEEAADADAVRSARRPGPVRSTSAPKACIALPVSSTSCPSSSPVIRVSPTASAPRISARCEIDLSPGTSTLPRSGPPASARIGPAAPCPAMPRLPAKSRALLRNRDARVHAAAGSRDDPAAPRSAASTARPAAPSRPRRASSAPNAAPSPALRRGSVRRARTKVRYCGARPAFERLGLVARARPVGPRPAGSAVTSRNPGAAAAGRAGMVGIVGDVGRDAELRRPAPSPGRGARGSRGS